MHTQFFVFHRSLLVTLFSAALLPFSTMIAPAEEGDSEESGGWITLFDGTNLDGWKSNEEKPDVFSVDEGALKVDGGRAHLFYVGDDPESPPQFKDFVLQAKVKTTSGSNSGIFFHTSFQEEGWPKEGFEAQINTTHGDRRKTGSIYGVEDVRDDAPSTDEEWFDYEIRVEGQTITTKVNSQTAAQWTQPEAWTPPQKMPGREIGSGTFAIQGHDPKSVVYFDEIRVKPLD
jgi:hypothetical protein